MEEGENMKFDLNNRVIKENILKGGFGLEKESLRVDEDGYLSHTQHPFLGNRYIDRDFCENQVELITDPGVNADKAYEDLKIIHRETVKSLYTLETGKEVLWPFSNPPYVKGEDDIPVASFQGNLKNKEFYRQYLARKYGKKKMLFSGIHVNYSFALELLEEDYKGSHFQKFKDYKNDIYLNLAKKIVKYSWFIVYLTAASPLLDGSFFDDDQLGETVHKNLGSARCSEIGYWNDFIPILNYENIEKYVESIQKYVDNGQLKETSELYYPVRLKPKGINNIDNLRQRGINHIELRMIDLNPFSPINLMKEDIEFLNLLIIYLMSLDDEEFDETSQIRAIQNEKAAAKYDDKQINIEISDHQFVNIRQLSLELLYDMDEYFSDFHNHSLKNIIQFQRDKIIYHQRYVERVREEFSEDYVSLGLKKAKEYAQKICKGE